MTAALPWDSLAESWPGESIPESSTQHHPARFKSQALSDAGWLCGHVEMPSLRASSTAPRPLQAELPMPLCSLLPPAHLHATPWGVCVSLCPGSLCLLSPCVQRPWVYVSITTRGPLGNQASWWHWRPWRRSPYEQVPTKFCAWPPQATAAGPGHPEACACFPACSVLAASVVLSL